MSGRSPRRKGFEAEREVCRIANSWYLEAKRTIASQYPDVTIEGRPVSVKRRKNGMEWAYKELDEPNPHDYVLFRSDRHGWLKISKWLD